MCRYDCSAVSRCSDWLVKVFAQTGIRLLCLALVHLQDQLKAKVHPIGTGVLVNLCLPRFLSQESTLHLVLRLRGGAKKRKKKSYTTPKKNKHKRKKVKLAVLKYYKVGAGNGPGVSLKEDVSGCQAASLFPALTFCFCRWMKTVKSTVCGASVQLTSAAPACSWPVTSTATTAESAA